MTSVRFRRSSVEYFDLGKLGNLSGIIVDIIVIVGAGFAVIKFQLFNVLGHRWRSELVSTHHDLPDNSAVFTTDYTINNTGERPLLMKKVTIRIAAARQDGVLLLPDETRILAERIFADDDPRFTGLFQIEPGERSIFPLRAKFPNLEEVIFVLCDFTLVQKRKPGAYRGIYVRHPAKSSRDKNGK